MNPSSDVCKIDAYPEAVFFGMYGHEDHTDPACAKSRIRFIITFAVNCCARYMFCPKHSHELALKRIVRYLKQTPDKRNGYEPLKRCVQD